MREGRKERARADARADALSRVADRLLAAWLTLATHSGLEHLAEPVEDAVDAVEGELEELVRGEDDLDVSDDQLRALLEEGPDP